MWDGCVEIVHGFDTKDGWFLLAVALGMNGAELDNAPESLSIIWP